MDEHPRAPETCPPTGPTGTEFEVIRAIFCFVFISSLSLSLSLALSLSRLLTLSFSLGVFANLFRQTFYCIQQLFSSSFNNYKKKKTIFNDFELIYMHVLRKFKSDRKIHYSSLKPHTTDNHNKINTLKWMHACFLFCFNFIYYYVVYK